MPKNSTPEPQWLAEPEDHNCPAAESYLNLIYPTKQSAKLVAGLRRAETMQFNAKDIFRASQLSLLGVSNFHVEKNQKKINDGTALSPILPVQDHRNGRVVVADGYHRLCAAYTHEKDTWISCRIV